MIGSVVLFGLNYPVLKYLVDQIPHQSVNALRLTISCVVLGVIYLYYRDRRQSLLQPLRDGGGLIVAIGIVGYFLSPFCFLIGMSYSSASAASIILASSPVWTALFGRLLGVESISLLGWVALVGSLAGSVVVTVGNGLNSATSSTLFGNIILFADSILWGGTIVLKRRLMDRVSVIDMTFWSLVIALPFLYLSAIPFYGTISLFVSTWTVLGSLLFTGVFSMGLAILWWNVAIRELGPTTTGLYGNGIPLIGVVSSLLFLGEPMTWLKGLGIILIVAGVLLIRREHSRSTRRIVGRLQT